VKDILTLVAKAVGELGERDQRYAKQFGQLTARIRETTQWTDLTAIRDSLQNSVADLTDCVSEMTKDGRDSVAQLRYQLAAYETRLEEVQRLASVDTLTGLLNRRGLESRLEQRIENGRWFTIIYLDLNGFKQLNDTLGHSAGDDLLKQFSAELRNACRATDIVGRWGGDEFLVLVDDVMVDSPATDSLLARMDQWVAGEYSPFAAGATPGGGAAKGAKVKVSCAHGVAMWKPGDTLAEVLQQADAAMYRRKARMKSPAEESSVTAFPPVPSTK
jgi:diguanylate cyclase (GGDEF)-like protein